MIFAYCRISTTKEKQKTDRQLEAIKQYSIQNGFKVDEYIEERYTGAVMDRPKYVALKQKMRRGDIIIVTDVDRLGRDASKVIVEFQELKELGIKVVALDTPYLNVWETIKQDSLYNMVVDILITLKAHLAEQEREKLKARINQGLDAARAKGKVLGRPPRVVGENIKKIALRVQKGELKKVEAAAILGISRQHFDRLIAKL